MKDNDAQKLREKLVIKVIMCLKDLSVEQLKKVIEYIDWFRVQNYAKKRRKLRLPLFFTRPCKNF
ncbi:hypothetical protein [Allobaculum sp. Allo2]|uniref:hypothetical protein n=1 Tax=Allobaculum sp. Allo2 TaxID=2853432 RepID=UPI001F604A4A|nr:hypothetical protein [Allobaculum sp. Allo2]UNT92203.1 hypothetical protein KWG61_08180 [Allobaculum sp. Allo2]